MNYSKANELLTGRNSQRRKLDHNTYLERHSEYIAVRLHNTDIIELYPDGNVKINSGGWQTVTTKDRLNKFLPDPEPCHIRLTQEKRVWYVYFLSESRDWDNALRYVFKDGFTYNSNTGEVSNGEIFQESNLKASNKLKRQISTFTKKYMTALDAGEVKAPSDGDCWYCMMRVGAGDTKTGVLHADGTLTNEASVGVGFRGKTLGESNGDSSHILSHFEESYFVPSLLSRAIELFPVSIAAKNWYLCGLWDTSAEKEARESAVNAGRGIGQEQLRRSLVRYLSRQLGLAS